MCQFWVEENKHGSVYQNQSVFSSGIMSVFYSLAGLSLNYMYICDNSIVMVVFHLSRSLSDIKDREICCYSISCKERENIGKC